MRTKSIADICKQTDRIRAGYGWKARRDKWDYDRFTEVSRKVKEIEHRYIRAIGEYQREAEGMTREQQEQEWDSIIHVRYPASVYAGNIEKQQTK